MSNPRPDPPELPPLAPRRNPSTSSVTETSKGRPRSSNRSRAGCWTCRNRKVKCDEVHPRCGHCVRLNRTCDWEQRWIFNDATQGTQNRFTNVNTTGNPTWDPNAPRPRPVRDPPSPQRDRSQAFAALTNDEERERMAEGSRPGTYTVIVNQDSFSSMPEYASPSEDRRESIQSMQSSMGSTSSDPGRGVVIHDPNTVVLTRFEDAVPSLPSFNLSNFDRRPSLPGELQRLDIGARPAVSRASSRVDSVSQQGLHDNQLLKHYEQKISPRLLALSRHNYAHGTQDPIIEEAQRYPPLHHAVCALSLMTLHHKGLANSEDALIRIGQSTSLLSESVRSQDIDLQSDGLFYLHFILLICDACNLIDDDNLWHRHVHHLAQSITTRRRQKDERSESLDYMVGLALWLDTQAALSGRDSGAGLLRAHINNDLFPATTPAHELQVTPFGQYPTSEQDMLAQLMPFGKAALTMLGRLGAIALSMRNETLSPHSQQAAQQLLVARQRTIRQFHVELYEFWNRAHPPFLPLEDPTARQRLSPRLRHIYDSGLLSLCICAIYSHTCMFPGQLLRNAAARPEVSRNCNTVLDTTAAILQDGSTDPRVTGYAVFLAGFAATDYDTKVRAITLSSALEERCVSDNGKRARELLVAVCEEQRQRVLGGGRAEDVDWIMFARARRMETFNFGL